MAVFPSVLLLPISLLLSVVHSATVTYDLEVSWVDADPDGATNRPVMGVNGQWPPPAIEVNKGDQVIVNLKNSLGNETTSLHFHGLYQNGTTHMDGPVQVTQCAVGPGESFTYNFTVDQPGTYWYHSHNRGQYPDGLRGPFIVHDSEDPHKDLYDKEVVLTFSDWYHDPMATLLASFINIANPSGAEPVPDAALMNDTQNLTVSIEPGKTYLFRMINIGAFAAQYVWFEDHTMQIVEVDGIYTEPTDADMIYLAAAQRYSVLVTAKNSTDANFAIVGSMDQELFDTVPATLNPNVTGWLVYNDQKEKPAAKIVEEFAPYDDFDLVPTDKEGIFDKVDHSLEITMKMDNLIDGANYAFMNDVTYVNPKVPTLYTVLSSGANATNPLIYGSNTNQFVLAAGETVEIVLNNNDPGKHPFHLHGHNFQVVSRSDEDGGDFVSNASTTAAMPTTPMRRDTVLVRPNGNVVLRFRADNPGVWLFHCHIEWHVASGLLATIIEDPLALQTQLQGKIPADHLAACKSQNVPTAGNAAGNTVDFLDLKGENKPPGPIPAGFTARGIVALVFSCISAFLGMGVLSWYGLKPVKAKGA